MFGRLVLGFGGVLALVFMTFAFGIYGLLGACALFVIAGWANAKRA